MIDLISATKEFDNYYKSFGIDTEKFLSKYNHSFRVMKISQQIAKGLNLTQNDIHLATIIGLLHDIARFKQYELFQIYSDTSTGFDHGDEAVKILKENDYIRKYNDDPSLDRIIYAAIKNHNKFAVEDGLDDRTMLFCNIIRDADKIDILYEAVNIFYDTEEKKNVVEVDRVKDDIYNQFMSMHIIKRYKDISPMDNFIDIISFIFDINFDYSKDYIIDHDFINEFYNMFDFSNNPDKDKLEEIITVANDYLKK